ncbi:MAG TPA: hypothetical protein VFZ09_24705 [Archangium sp.]|uniref:hypothetical protein n=1 Tax=Archangium sp. TaxID=1872627 RepID=UPI002E310B78|nr:hypothetical protein [Archangium sp.]HEX5749452.1 hypothetical protein [Archangium sp.]
MEHVTIQGSTSPGAVLAGTTGFAEGSTKLTITASGSQALPEPLALNPNALGTVPSGRYTGNRPDAISVSSEVASSSVYYLGQDATLRDVGVPYRMDGLTVGGAGAQATLTVEAGVEVRVTLQNVRVRYAGGDCQCSSYGCNYLAGSFSVSSAILLFNQPTAAFITGSRVEYSAGHGILRGWSGASDVSFLGSNTFADVAGCTETTPRDVEGRCPANPPCPKSP